jgi:hypothetical protein
MTATLLAPPAEIIRLSGISWKTYETLLEELRDRLPIPDIAIWLQRSATIDYLALVKAFRGWVRSQIGENDI